jgi:hypothetical protein
MATKYTSPVNNFAGPLVDGCLGRISNFLFLWV